MFDKGNSQNYESGILKPPVYNLTDIKVPVALFVGKYDALVDANPIFWLSVQLKDVLVWKKDYNYGHLGYFVAKNMSYMDDIDSLLQKHHN
jgi:hypothetical protein